MAVVGHPWIAGWSTLGFAMLLWFAGWRTLGFLEGYRFAGDVFLCVTCYAGSSPAEAMEEECLVVPVADEEQGTGNSR